MPMIHTIRNGTNSVLTLYQGAATTLATIQPNGSVQQLPLTITRVGLGQGGAAQFTQKQGVFRDGDSYLATNPNGSVVFTGNEGMVTFTPEPGPRNP